jgi:hypothetical protein
MTTPPPDTAHDPRERARRLFDKVPTKGLVTGGVVVVLGVSALLGGLDAAPVEAVPVVGPGEPSTGTQLEVTVEAVVLIDAFPEQFIEPEPGNRLLVVRAVVENVWPSPVRLTSWSYSPDSEAPAGFSPDAVVPDGVEGITATTPPDSVLIIDDSSDETQLQPGVPTELAFIWQVPDDALADGDDVRVDIMDREYERQGILVYGDVFSDYHVSAHVDLAVSDVGAGTDTTADDNDDPAEDEG